MTVRKAFFVSLIFVIVLPFLVLGCQSQETIPAANISKEVTAVSDMTKQPAPSSVAPSIGQPQDVRIEIASEEFGASKNIVKDVNLIQPGTLTVSLGSNPTTGFQWDENAVISDSSIVKQASHAYIPPQPSGDKPVVGAGGKEVWVFNSLKAGTSTLTLSYGRPWEGGEKGVWTLTLNVNVK
jgi:inhibitor of cysteine peptidase